LGGIGGISGGLGAIVAAAGVGGGGGGGLGGGGGGSGGGDRMILILSIHLFLIEAFKRAREKEIKLATSLSLQLNEYLMEMNEPSQSS